MTRFNRNMFAVSIAAWLCVTGTVLAQQTVPTGTWHGAMPDTSAPVQVTSDGKHLSTHFGEPLSCKVDADFSTAKQEGSYYAIAVPQNGGAFCKKLYPGLWLATTSGNNLTLALQQRDASKQWGTKWSITLTHP